MKRVILVSLALVGGFGLPVGWGQVISQPNPVSAITPTTTTVPLGPELDVIPYVDADGYTIQMNLLPSVVEFVGYDNPGQFSTQVGNLTAALPLPHFTVRQVTTSAIVWDGQTIVLGGLISETVQKTKDKVPVLGDIPLLGRLFRSEANNSEKKNLMIFVTPTIIDPAGNKVHSEDNLPYNPNTIPPQTPFAPTSAPANGSGGNSGNGSGAMGGSGTGNG